MVYRMLYSLRILLPCVVLAVGSPVAAASTWNFASGGNSYTTTGNSWGNRLTFAQGTETLKVTAWANTANGMPASFETAYLGRYSTGLGVCNRDEGSVSNCINRGLDHQVDNVSQQDLVLFLFDSLQAMQSLTVDPYGTWDRDVSFWVGTVSPGVSLGGLNFGTLASLGFGGQVNSLNSAGDAPLTVGLGGLVGNALLVGARYPADGSPDRFKIRSLVTMTPTTVVPLPAAAWLFLSALGSIAGLRRLA
ncbi:MAG: VPLPA-CTERM sorting domain-containing protein [Chromatiales bacterium]|nr:VPLPA-CTERM sorting domain-containing protein [Chromatiales bacterium]